MSGVGPIAREPNSAVCDRQQGLGRDLDRLFCHILGRVRDIADKAEPITGADHLGAESGDQLNGSLLPRGVEHITPLTGDQIPITAQAGRCE
jgi:hypothetical protein